MIGKNPHNDQSIEKKESVTNQDGCPVETLKVDGYYSEHEIIKSRVKYHPRRTRHIMALILVLSLLISIVVFGVLIAFGKKEMVDSLQDFARYSLTVLSSLTGAAIGFFFGRDIRDDS